MSHVQGSILVVDDEFSVRDSLEQWFKKDGYRVASAENGNTALARLDDGPWDLIFMDIKMPGMDGMELLRRVMDTDCGSMVVMITAYGSVDTAVEALKLGAFDYITKPIDPDELTHVARRAIEKRQLENENLHLRQRVEKLIMPTEMVGDSPQMRKVLEMVGSVAQTDATVVIHGESGTGKELVAQAIHASSSRRFFPIVPVNCGALPESLLESELFGHEKGAFTGALYQRKGKLEMAHGGSLFLDEVGTIDGKTQIDLLRVLESKEFTRLGGSTSIKVDFRVICATNQNLATLVEQGKFREDLYFRLNVISIEVPPLRERREDIPALVHHFLGLYSRQMNRLFHELEPEAMDLMVRYAWPGNVRELANAVERALVVGRAPVVRVADLPLSVSNGSLPPTGDRLEDIERAHIADVLERLHWNISRSAQVLGIDRGTLYTKVKKFNLRA